CCVRKFKEWILANAIATQEEIDEIEKTGKKEVNDAKKASWEAYLNPIKAERNEVVDCITKIVQESANASFIQPLLDGLKSNTEPLRKDIISAAKKTLRLVRNENISAKAELATLLKIAA
ncbi:MAG: transketolase, partial [Flavobacteriaceae bacterium]|nr:transketolase [Flavobacteriaceae bacterium]